MKNLGNNTAYNLLSSKQLEGFKVGCIWKIPSDNIRHYIEKQSLNYLGIFTRNVYILIHKGILLAYKIDNSNSWHIPEEAVQNYVVTCLHKSASSMKKRAWVIQVLFLYILAYYD